MSYTISSKRGEDIMDFQLTKEQQLLKKMAAQFAAQCCEPEAAELSIEVTLGRTVKGTISKSFTS